MSKKGIIKSVSKKKTLPLKKENVTSINDFEYQKMCSNIAERIQKNVHFEEANRNVFFPRSD